jgi:hypothetical protein
MSVPRWLPRETTTRREEFLLKRLGRVRKLFGFLRQHRRVIFNDAFQDELATMYRDTGAGSAPVPPALMAMAALLQGYTGASDAEVVELTVVDLRWQLVLDCLGADEPVFSQGTFQAFRERFIRSAMDVRLLERSAEVARETGAFDWRKLPKTLRVAVDSRPLEGAGRVEDTVNLLGHAARNVVVCVAELLDWSVARVAKTAGIPLLLESSVKKGLDVEWSDAEAKVEAVARLARELDHLVTWIKKKLPEEMRKPPLREHLATLAQIRTQDLEPDPTPGSNRQRIRDGVAEDRRVSIEDPAMRHGRKSTSHRFNGYKQHVATDLVTNLIIGCVVTPANQPEEQAAEPLKAEVDRAARRITEWHCDRGYIASPVTAAVLDAGGEVVCKPWVPRNGDLFTKADFKINLRALTITCPAGEIASIVPGSTAKFDAQTCQACDLRPQCTQAKGQGRQVRIAEDEALQRKLRRLIATKAGRERLRERVAIEHTLGRIARRQGRRARYVGVRKNLFDLRRVSAIQNLEIVHRRLADAEAANARIAA